MFWTNTRLTMEILMVCCLLRTSIFMTIYTKCRCDILDEAMTMISLYEHPMTFEPILWAGYKNPIKITFKLISGSPLNSFKIAMCYDDAFRWRSLFHVVRQCIPNYRLIGNALHSGKTWCLSFIPQFCDVLYMTLRAFKTEICAYLWTPISIPLNWWLWWPTMFICDVAMVHYVTFLSNIAKLILLNVTPTHDSKSSTWNIMITESDTLLGAPIQVTDCLGKIVNYLVLCRSCA